MTVYDFQSDTRFLVKGASAHQVAQAAQTVDGWAQYRFRRKAEPGYAHVYRVEAFGARVQQSRVELIGFFELADTAEGAQVIVKPGRGGAPEGDDRIFSAFLWKLWEELGRRGFGVQGD